MYILPVDEATYTSQHCNYQRSLTDIDTQAMITSPQWLHLDGHIYDIERTQSSSPSNECITRSRDGRLENMIQMRCSLTSLNFVYQTAKIIYTARLVGLQHHHQLLTHSKHLELAHVNNAANALAGVHVVEGLVDAAERLTVGDELVDLQLALHVVVDQVGELRAALDTAESTALPHTAGDELECCERKSVSFVRAALQ